MNEKIPSYGAPVSPSKDLGGFGGGEFTNLNASKTGAPEVVEEARKALGEFAGVRSTTKISDLVSSGKTSLPENGETNFGNPKGAGRPSGGRGGSD